MENPKLYLHRKKTTKTSTPLKFNMEPENQPLEKEIPLETIIFRFHVKLWGCTFAILRNKIFRQIRVFFFLVARRSSLYQAVSLFPVAQFRMKKIPAQNYPQSSDHWMNSITPIGSMEMIYVPTFIIKINQSWLILMANVGKYIISTDASWDCGFGFS